MDWGTAKRAIGKLRGWFVPKFKSAAQPELRPQIHAPKMWPSFRTPLARKLNNRMLSRALVPHIKNMAHNPAVVTTLPLIADLIGQLPAERWIYYCVDDFSVWPGYDGETMLRMERDLVPKVDVIVAVSETLQNKFADSGKPVHLLTHGVDLDHWRNFAAGPLTKLTGLEPPIILFWGVIDRRLDLSFVERLSQSLQQGTLLFVGPQEDPDPRLFGLPRVSVLPAMPYSELPALAQQAEVLIMPYVDAAVTRAMQPLKLKEYLATGKPAVVRRLPSTEHWQDAADLAATPEEFAQMVQIRISEGILPAQTDARRRLEAESWASKARQFEDWVNAGQN